MAVFSEYKDNIKPGDLLVWSRPQFQTTLGKWISNIIRFFTMSDFYHTAVVTEVTDDDVFQIEATWPEVFEGGVKNRTPFFHIPMNVKVTDEDLEFIRSFLGQKYSLFEAVMAYFGFLRRDKSWICTEFSAKFYNRVIGDKFNDLLVEEDYGDTYKAGRMATPSEFVKTVLANFDTSMVLVTPDKK